jgi:uncharacterized membrane protein
MAGVSLVSSAFLLAGAVLAATADESPAYRRADEVAAFEWLDAHAAHRAVVLAAYSTGNALPAWADVRVVIGHGPESAGLATLRPQVEAFYRESGATAEAAGLLAEYGVDYVFAGPAERALGFNDMLAPGEFVPGYVHGAYTIYQVTAGTSAGGGAQRTLAHLAQPSIFGAGR